MKNYLTGALLTAALLACQPAANADFNITVKGVTKQTGYKAWHIVGYWPITAVCFLTGGIPVVVAHVNQRFDDKFKASAFPKAEPAVKGDFPAVTGKNSG